MKTTAHQADEQTKKAFLAEAAALWPVAKGSLTQTRSPCTRKNCKACASGRKHPKLLFTFREEGKLRGLYVRPAHAERLRRAIANGRKLERMITAAGCDLVLALREETKA
jgi:hypothetical protein